MQQTPPQISAGTLVLDLCTAAQDTILESAALCDAGQLFGLSEQNVRVTLTRLVKSGQLIKEQRGRYRINPDYDTLTGDVIGWRSRVTSTVPWKRGWIGVCDTNTPRSARTPWNRHVRALDFRGFRQSPSGLHLRPNNLGGGFVTIRRDLYGLGLSQRAIVVEIAQLAPDEQAMAARLWEADRLDITYRKAIEQIDMSERQLKRASREKAARETLLLGHALIRQVISDPLLPDGFVDVRLRRELVSRLTRYQDNALRLWLQILT